VTSSTVYIGGVDTGRVALGGPVGDRAVLGIRALIKAGTAIPADALLVARPDEALGRVDDDGLARAHMQLGERGRDI
jgi:carbonic anhydrase/acetyltransferase-like protein (isoleucine patch superfamily)